MAKINNVRIVPTKYGTYALHYTNPEGRRRRLSVGPDYYLAQHKAIKFTDWLFAGRDPEKEIRKVKKVESARRVTIRELFPDFMTRHGNLKSENMQTSYRNSFKNICRCPEIADSPIGEVTLTNVLDYSHVRMKQDKVKPATVNREAAFLQCLFSRAVEWDILERNPLERIKRIPESEKRDVSTSVEEIGALINELSDQIASIVEFAVYSGFRRGNILALKVEDLIFHDKQKTGEVLLVIKGGTRKRFFLGPLAIAVLQRTIGNRKEGFVFLNPNTETRYVSINKSFDNAVKKIGLEVNGTKLRFHDLRHVFATWLRGEGVSLDDIRDLLGHKDRNTTDRYVTSDPKSTLKALTVMPRILRNEPKKTLTIDVQTMN